MKRTFILSMIRHGLTFGGGALVTQGALNETEMTEGIGAVITLLGIGWSLLEKWNAKKAAATVGLIGLIGLMGFGMSARAQEASTNTQPATLPTLWDFVTTGSNYFAVPFATYAPEAGTFGGGVALGYRITEVVAPVLRLDYFDGSFWNVSLTANLQAPRYLFGKVPVIPFAIAGIATPLSGDNSGHVVSVVGGGAVLHLDWVGDGDFWKRAAVVADYEKWIGLEHGQEDQVRFGFAVAF